ncbi:MAG: hypothetical protein AAB300_04735, partial [Nitrospirota bacterium]
RPSSPLPKTAANYEWEYYRGTGHINFTSGGSGKGGRSFGTGVMEISLTISPLRSRMTVFFGIIIFMPGINGVEMTVSSSVGEGI